MDNQGVIPSLILSSYALGRIAARDAENDAPAAQWRVLSIIEQAGPQRVGALAVAARTTQPGMTRLIGVLERDGLVLRSPVPDDSRAIAVSVTPAGSEALRSWRAEYRDILAPRFADLSDEDWRTLTRAAEILAARTAVESTGASQ